MSSPTRRTRLRAHSRWWVVLAVAIAGLVPLSVTAPAQAAPEDLANCVDPHECVYFVSGYSDAGDFDLDSETSWDLEPIPPLDEGQTEAGLPRQGTFRIIQHSTAGIDPQCLETIVDGMTGIQRANLEDCNDDFRDQRWYIEPVDTGVPVVTDPDASGAWNPWYDGSATWTQAARRNTKFYLRSAGRDDVAGMCFGNTGGLYTLDVGNNGLLRDCGNLGGMDPANFEWNLHPGGAGWVTKPDGVAQQKVLSKHLMTWALRHAAAMCGVDARECAARLYDRERNERLSEWSRVESLAINTAPTPVVVPMGCVGGDPADGVGAQTIYNAGTQPMTATLGASGTSSYSHSINSSLAVEVEKEFNALVTKAKVTVTATVGYGKTWSESTTVSQSVNWTIPPQRYASAALTTSALRLTAEWRFNRDEDANQWITDRFTELDVPFSSDPDASGPESTMSVFNSFEKKSCGASSPSRLDPDETLRVENTTSPDLPPIVGDVLRADADPDWWQAPDIDVVRPRLRYQWYRQRGNQPAEPINHARQSTYEVSSDDVTDDEELERRGRYRLYVGVIDVANQQRHDSAEYTSIATPGVWSERSGIGATELDLRVVNPGVDADTDTLLDVTATVLGAGAVPSGTVALLDNGEVIEPEVELGADGTVRVPVRLGRGEHHLEAIYDGDGTAGAAQSDVVQTTVTGAASRTTVTLPTPTVSVGDRVPVTVTVRRQGAGGSVPSGQVQLLDSDRTLGAPVDLDATGTATAQLPGFTAAGPRQIRASYLGDDTFDPSSSPAATQYVTTTGTTVDVRLGKKVTHRAGKAVLRARVASTGAGRTPRGRVQFLVDGQTEGPLLALDSRGAAVLRTTGLPAGKRRVTAQFVPDASSAVDAPAMSTARILQVRRHGVKVKPVAEKRRVKRKERVVVTGKVVLRAKGPKLGRGKVRLLLDGTVLKRGRLQRDGTFRLRVRAKRLARGKNTLMVDYRGSAPRSIAPETSRGFVVRRR